MCCKFDIYSLLHQRYRRVRKTTIHPLVEHLTASGSLMRCVWKNYGRVIGRLRITHFGCFHAICTSWDDWKMTLVSRTTKYDAWEDSRGQFQLVETTRAKNHLRDPEFLCPKNVLASHSAVVTSKHPPQCSRGVANSTTTLGTLRNWKYWFNIIYGRCWRLTTLLLRQLYDFQCPKRVPYSSQRPFCTVQRQFLVHTWHGRLYRSTKWCLIAA